MRRLGPAALVTAVLAAGCGGGDDQTVEIPSAALTLAVIGDTPYGEAQVAGFPSDIARINADREVRAVVHLGDIQEGPSRCDDGYLRRIRRQLDGSRAPVLYTPGDNEWTDCHLPPKGGASPLRRLARLRAIFFDRPGRTRGARPMSVTSQGAPLVENVRWVQARTVLTTLHVPGSNNGREPWFEAATPADQAEEGRARLRANLRWLDRAFDVAKARRAVAVVVAMQADMWPPAGSPQEVSGYRPIVDRLAKRARAFRRPVLVLQGDSHVFRSDRPLRRGSPLHEVRTAAPNVQRIVVQGAESVPREWLRLRVYPRKPSVFAVERVRL